jgi:hypothetical protein
MESAVGHKLLQAFERGLEHLREILGVTPHRTLLVRIGRALPRLHYDPRRGLSVRLELDPDNCFEGKSWGWLAPQPLGLVAPFEQATRLECSDYLVDLGLLALPGAADALAAAEAGALQHLNFA